MTEMLRAVESDEAESTFISPIKTTHYRVPSEVRTGDVVTDGRGNYWEVIEPLKLVPEEQAFKVKDADIISWTDARLPDDTEPGDMVTDGCGNYWVVTLAK